MAGKVIAVLAASTLPLLVRAQDPADAAIQPYWLSRKKQANIANCVVDIGIASTFLGKAGIAINAAVENCGAEGDTTAACTASITGIVASFSFGAAFISASAAECRSSLRVVNENAVLNEACAAGTSVIVATLSLMANAGAVIKATCPGVRPDMEGGPTATEAEALDSSVRRLREADPAEHRRLSALGGNKTLVYEKLREAARKLEKGGFKIPKSRKMPHKKEEEVNGRTAAQNAACAFDVGQFTFLSARAGLMINYAVQDCSAQALFEGGNINRAKCITDVGRTIGAFGYTASGIAFAVFECPDIIDNLNAACAGSIVNLVAGTAELMGNGADLFTTCHQLGKGPEEEARIERLVADPERRLSMDAAAAEDVQHLV